MARTPVKRTYKGLIAPGINNELTQEVTQCFDRMIREGLLQTVPEIGFGQGIGRALALLFSAESGSAFAMPELRPILPRHCLPDCDSGCRGFESRHSPFIFSAEFPVWSN